MPDELVSIVIPTFNKGRLIEATLNSVLLQTYPFLEVLLIDNGSTDDTREKIDYFLLSHPGFCRVIDMKENIGPSNARNVGILEAKGKYIFLLDGDDLMMPKKIEKQVRYMDKNPSIGLSLTPYLIYSSGRRFPVRLVSELDPRKLVRGWIGMSYFGGLVESTGCFRRSHLDPALLFDLTLMGSEGLDFTIKWLERFDVGVLEEPLTIYRISPYQLHHDVGAISENVTRVTDKYVALPKERVRLLNQQAAFFRLNDIRFKPKFFVLRFLFVSFVTFNFFNIRMAWWIATRNIRAIINGARYRRVVDRQLDTVEMESPFKR
jgi:glycosyltransferase involved in cell wall biosynthesis